MSHELGRDIAVGTIFQDRYKIQQPLSAGGFGVVYKAEQLTTGQAVAIKYLQRRGQTKAEDRKILARFRRETQLCAQLHHPNIVRLIDSGQSEDGLLYTVFEYVPGKNLRQVLAQEGRLSPAEAKHLMTQVLDAMSCAHAQGIIHRDIKPANIMVVPSGARRNAMVLDFGIGALSREVQGEDYDHLTTTMGGLGTPAYSSPEQLRGHELTTHSDIYSWGLVFLECLTGQRAMQGGSVAEIMHKQLSLDPILIPQALRDHALNTLLRITTAKNVAHRQISTARLLALLDKCDVSGVELAPPGSQVPILMQDADDASTLSIPQTPSEDALVQAFTQSGTAHARQDGGVSADSPNTLTGRTLDMSGERRQITVLACSLELALTRGEFLDIEEHEELLAAQVGFCADLARRSGGYLAGEYDDELVIYYGYPRARGDDAARAVRTALDIAAAFEKHNRKLQASRDLRARLRMGVHSGLVVIKSRAHPGQTPKIAGRAPRMAAQLAAAACAGTVEISAATERLLRNRFETEPLEPRQLRGQSEPMAVFRVVAAHRRDETQSTTFDRDTTPLVGRDEDLALLERLWSEAGSGQGQAVLITGEAGIGKSRMVRELGRRLGRASLSWLETRCMEDSRNSALHPFIELLQRQLSHPGDAGTADNLDQLAALLQRYNIDPDEAVPILAPLLSMPLGPGYQPVDVSSQRRRQLTLSALLSLLVEMSTDSPLVLVIEDVHWADATTVELLSMLLGEVSMAPLMVLLTARPSFEPPWSASTISMLRLGRLTGTTVTELIGKAAGDRSLSAEMIDEIVRRTEGVPLFVEEMVQAILESADIAHDRTVGDAMAELGIPATLRDLLTARLDSLDDTARSLAQLAAVMGREFSYDLLLAICDVDDARLRAAMNQLTHAGLMHHRRRLSGDIYVFKHALMHEAAYDSLSRDSRQRHHARIARVMEEKVPALAAARPDLLARHYAGGGEIATALGHIRRAALDALGKSANHEAVGHAKLAISWLSGLDDARERAEMELSFYAVIAPAMLGTQGHGHDEFIRWAARAEELMAMVGDSPYTQPTLWGLWLHHYVCSRFEEAARHARAQVAWAERSSDAAAQASTMSILAVTLFYMGRLVEARNLGERCLALYREDMSEQHQLMLGHDIRATQQGTLGQSLWLMGYPDLGRKAAETGLMLTRPLKHPMSTCFALFHLGYIRLWDQDRAGTREIGEEIQAIAQRHGLNQWLFIAEFFLSAADLDAVRGQDTLDRFRAAGQSIGQTHWAATIAASEAAAGNMKRAIELVREAIESAEQAEEKFFYAGLHYQLGRYLSQTGDRDAAEASLRRAIEIARGQKARMLELMATTALCRLLAEQDAHHDIRDALNTLCAWFTDGEAHPALLEAHALVAEIAM